MNNLTASEKSTFFNEVTSKRIINSDEEDFRADMERERRLEEDEDFEP